MREINSTSKTFIRCVVQEVRANRLGETFTTDSLEGDELSIVGYEGNFPYFDEGTRSGLHSAKYLKMKPIPASGGTVCTLLDKAKMDVDAGLL